MWHAKFHIILLHLLLYKQPYRFPHVLGAQNGIICQQFENNLFNTQCQSIIYMVFANFPVNSKGHSLSVIKLVHMENAVVLLKITPLIPAVVFLYTCCGQGRIFQGSVSFIHFSYSCCLFFFQGFLMDEKIDIQLFSISGKCYFPPKEKKWKVTQPMLLCTQ